MDIEIFYYPDDRLFTDSDGFEILNPYKFLSPSDIKIFWYFKRDLIFQKNGYDVYIFYQNDTEESEYGSYADYRLIF